ncbi:MAG: DNA methyltransferase [Firmicutes bacterium]|nr:DNA methyltransferase [Bacillota bacterium]
MAGKQANLVVTDPPYNVNYEGTAGKIQNDNMDNDSFYQFLLDAFTNMAENMADDASIYVFHADTEAQKSTADGIDEQLMELQKELLKKANNKEAYDEIADQIFKLREQREKCTVDTAARDAQIARINDLQDYIKQQRTDLAKFDETLVKRWLKQITVWEDHFTVELKSGLKIDIEG